MKFWDLFQFDDEPDPAVLNQEFAAIEAAARGLQGRRRRLFVCDCAERVLSIYENHFKDDDRVRTAIMEARRSVFGIATSAALAAAHKAAKTAYKEALFQAPQEFKENWPPALIAEAAVLSSIDDFEKLDAALISRNILNAVKSTSPHVLRESRWQYKRLRYYLEQSPLVVPPRGPR